MCKNDEKILSLQECCTLLPKNFKTVIQNCQFRGQYGNHSIVSKQFDLKLKFSPGMNTYGNC